MEGRGVGEYIRETHTSKSDTVSMYIHTYDEYGTILRICM